MQPILKVENLTKRFDSKRAFGKGHVTHAVNDVSFTLYPQTTLALVGPSGSGKSTVALCVALLERTTSGNMWFAGVEVSAMSEEQLRAVRPNIQLVFQDPAASLNPRFNALQLVCEPLDIQSRSSSRSDTTAQAHEALRHVGIPSENAKRRAGEFSGGQKQRIAIARALVLRPKVLVLDEALSALDCSVQAQIVNLLLELQKSLGLTYLFISHDLAMAAHVADEIAVMDRGTIVETGAPQAIMGAPSHDVTRRLLAASTLPTSGISPAVS